MIHTREIAKEYRLAHWAGVLQERAQSGLSIKEFCKQIGIGGNTYFYWQRRVRAAACEMLVKRQDEPTPGFAEVKMLEGPVQIPEPENEKSGHLHIETAGVTITADSTYPPEMLAALLRELARPC